MEETLEQIQARHRKEQRDLVARTTSKKKNATKKTRKGVNDECAELERVLKERQAVELAAAAGGDGRADDGDEDQEQGEDDEDLKREQAAADAPTDEIDGLAGRLGGAAITETQGKGVQREEAPPQGGKKRNRQKERLARRAAEQEEAAVRAEEEAKNMTDHRGIEKKYMAGVFEANGLVEKDIQPNGHCLFSAVADQLKQRGIPLGGGSDSTEPYRIVRRAAADWMAGRPDDYAPFLEEPLDGYLTKIRDTAEWGGQLELAALAARYGVEIKVVQDGRTETIETPSGGKDGEAAEVIWLAYYRHGYGLGEHYNSLRKTA
ncbi:OTU domain-containing protein 2 like [Verticillium longisporum]|uniref:OTU domain-containing protein 2 like n=2 Tax=Verticillium TaxID=1036719 RepID=A0A8I2Z2U6_VERLO|nr:OTU domain-containing protein 2 like [Verticillium longisporum]PNH43125.1 hypothetical protein VD0004_g4312 [Verticillium dahliae]PNH71773.1 hypothetical protein VD0001_g5768 [Verticillium dahliae]RXG48345.1 hypothetical protein VDGE_30108 [Verticillium dahliae]